MNESDPNNVKAIPVCTDVCQTSILRRSKRDSLTALSASHCIPLYVLCVKLIHVSGPQVPGIGAREGVTLRGGGRGGDQGHSPGTTGMQTNDATVVQ